MPTADEGDPALPAGFVSIKKALETVQGKFVSVIGVVKDCRAPISTSGSDFKCTIRTYDNSTTDGEEIELTIFRKESEMPEIGCGDVVAMTHVKTQNRGVPSLITNRAGAIRVYEAAKIPSYPKSASSALRPLTKADNGRISTEAEQYISWLFQTIDKGSLPDVQTFKLAIEQSRNVKVKSSLLKDFRQDRFYDMIVFVAREPYDYGDKMTLWVTDFTENNAFFHFAWDGGDAQGEVDTHGADAGDPFGYTGNFRKSLVESSSGFAGPYGRRCLQVTCYEPHATTIRDRLKKGSWVQLRNVQIKYGSNGSSLEGFLREDLGSVAAKIQVNPLNPRDDVENISPHLKEAIRRKRDYEKLFKANLHALQQNTHDQSSTRGQKRPATDQPKAKPPNSKERRQLARAEMGRKVQAEEQENGESSLGLHANVRCENTDRPPSSVAELLKRAVFRTEHDGQALEIALPFTCAKFRVNVRVIDFFPSNLEDFAVSRKSSEYEVLSDHGDDSDSGADADDGDEGDRIWEWRFALRLADAAKPTKGATPEDLWVVVDNADAQLLTSLDACDLRSDKEALGTLRERMFVLWGNLAELKAKPSERPRKTKKSKVAADRPPMDSSDVEGADPSPKKPDQNSKSLSNLPFSCCIRQYGIKVKEPNPLEANAGDGHRWERVFGLFGTKIRYA